LDFASLIVAESAEVVSDNMYNSYYTLERDKDFNIEKSIKIEEDTEEYISASSQFTDGDVPNSAGVAIKQTFSSGKTGEHVKYLILDYSITNISGEKKDTLRIGLYTDWDILDSMNNRSSYDSLMKLGLAYDADESTFAGVALISNQEATFQSVELYDDEWNFHFGNEISEDEKYNLLIDKPSRYNS